MPRRSRLQEAVDNFGWTAGDVIALRVLCVKKLVAAHRARELQFFGNHTALTQSKAFSAFLAPLRNSKWVVYCKRPFGGRKQVFAFVSKGESASSGRMSASTGCGGKSW